MRMCLFRCVLLIADACVYLKRFLWILIENQYNAGALTAAYEWLRVQYTCIQHPNDKVTEWKRDNENILWMLSAEEFIPQVNKSNEYDQLSHVWIIWFCNRLLLPANIH